MKTDDEFWSNCILFSIIPLPPVLSAHLLPHEGLDKETLNESTVRSCYQEKCSHESSGGEEHLAVFLPWWSHLLRKIWVSSSSLVVFTSLFTRTPLRGHTSLSVCAALKIAVLFSLGQFTLSQKYTAGWWTDCKTVSSVCSSWRSLEVTVQLDVKCQHWGGGRGGL